MPQAADRANQIFLASRSGNFPPPPSDTPLFLAAWHAPPFLFSWDGNEMIIASPPSRPLIGLNLFLDKVDRQNQYLTPPFSLQFRRALFVFL
ncbi:hypothetical protein CI238_11603, partial [Colletotrichum incanum]